MENIKKIIILISLITICAVIISIIDLNKKVNNLQNNLIENKEKNQAEVIIAKQRAGSTGTVDLAWLGQYTKFANLDKYRE